MAMVDYSRKQGIDVALRIYGNALVHRARNKAISERRPDADYVLMVDDDMTPEPEALCWLIEHQLPVVSGLCTTRQEPVEYAVKILNEESDQFCPIGEFRMNKVVKGKFAPGTAFVLIHRSVLEEVIEFWLSAKDWIEENRRLHDRMCVRAENREKERARIEEIRRFQNAQDGYFRLFDFPIIETQLQLGEDIAFFRKVLRCGFETAIDTGCWLGHIGDYAFGPWDIQPRKKEISPLIDRAAEVAYAHI